MKKKICILLLILLMCAVSVMPAFANVNYSRLCDDAELLSSQEYNKLLLELDRISSEHNFNVTIVTTYSLDGMSPERFAQKNYHGNAYSPYCGNDGIIFVVAMDDGVWCMLPFGSGSEAFTDNGLIYMEDEIIPYLSRGNYYKAFKTYADICEEFIVRAENGNPYGKESFNLFGKIVISLIIGMVIAFITLSSMKAKLKTVRPQKSAASYTKEGSMVVTGSRDMFLYRNVIRTAIPRDSGSSRGSSRTSSGGRSGKF